MKRLLFLFVTLLFISCNQEDANNYKLDGTAAGFDDGTEIMVFTLENNQPKIVDTLRVTEGKISATYPKMDDAGLHYMRITGYNNSILYFPENEDLKVSLYKDSLQSSHVTGGAQNEAYNGFSAQLRAFNKRKEQNMARYKIARSEQDNLLVTQIQQENLALVNEETQYKKSFIATNGNSIFAAMLVSEMLQRKEITGIEASEFVAGFSPKLAANPLTTAIKSSIEGMKGTEVGGLAPNFSSMTPSGEPLALADTLGEYTLIDFWASWCRPCRNENPNVVRVYNKYHDKGFNIISVSLDRDGQRDRWLKAIEDDNMDWYHVSNLKFWQDPVARMYNVRSIPATFLLDKEGRIIAKNLRGQALEAKIASLLGS